MTSTTLVTFFLDSVHGSSSVQILGSWDNFTTPYDMEKDKQKGHGCWYGCYLFKNIICDGDPAQSSGGREGGLIMGGTYWYYFKLNGHVEYHCPSAPHTSLCPLLPGQTVNVMEIPCETSHLGGVQSELSIAHSFTMDPNARFTTPKPPPKRTRDDSPPRYAKRSNKFGSTARPQTSAVGARWSKVGGSVREMRNGPLFTKVARKIKTAPAQAVSSQTYAVEDDDAVRDDVSVVKEDKYKQHAPPRRGPSYRRHMSILDRTPGWNPFRRIPEAPSSESSEDDVEGPRPPTRRGGERPQTWSHCSHQHQPLSINKPEDGRRPVSAPTPQFTSTPPEEGPESRTSSEILMQRQKSLRLRVACAKLRTMVNQNSDNSWILDCLPEDFSTLLQGFQSLQQDNQPPSCGDASEYESSSTKSGFPDLDEERTPRASKPKRKHFRPQLHTLYSGNDSETYQFPTLTTVSSSVGNKGDDARSSKAASNPSWTKHNLDWTPAPTSPSTEEWGGSGWDSPPEGSSRDESGVESPISLQSEAYGMSPVGSYELPYESKRNLSKVLESQETIRPPVPEQYQLAPSLGAFQKLTLDEDWDAFRHIERQWALTPRSTRQSEDGVAYRGYQSDQTPVRMNSQGDANDATLKEQPVSPSGNDGHLGDLGYLSAVIF